MIKIFHVFTWSELAEEITLAGSITDSFEALVIVLHLDIDISRCKSSPPISPGCNGIVQPFEVSSCRAIYGLQTNPEITVTTHQRNNTG